MSDFTVHINRIEDAHRRLDRHDDRFAKVESDIAVLNERYSHIQNSLRDLHSGQSWLIRLIIGAIILAGLTFVMKGGLNVGQ